MDPLPQQDIKGVWATPLLPIDENATADINAISDQIEYFASAGVNGVYSNGTAAELHGQSTPMFRALAETVALKCTELGLPFQLGASHPFAHDTLDRIAFVRELNPTAIQIILPDWVPVNIEEAKRFIDGCVNAADGIGLILYNPPHAKTVLGASDLVKLLLGTSGLLGVKCAGGGSDWYKSMEAALGQKSVFIPGHHMATGMKSGASGSYSNMACLNPAATVAWFNLIYSDLPAALELEKRINQFMKTAIIPFINAGYEGLACDKLMAHAGGWTQIHPRLIWPYNGIAADQSKMVLENVKNFIPEFLPKS